MLILLTQRGGVQNLGKTADVILEHSLRLCNGEISGHTIVLKNISSYNLGKYKFTRLTRKHQFTQLSEKISGHSNWKIYGHTNGKCQFAQLSSKISGHTIVSEYIRLPNGLIQS